MSLIRKLASSAFLIGCLIGVHVGTTIPLQWSSSSAACGQDAPFPTDPASLTWRASLERVALEFGLVAWEDAGIFEIGALPEEGSVLAAHMNTVQAVSFTCDGVWSVDPALSNVPGVIALNVVEAHIVGEDGGAVDAGLMVISFLDSSNVIRHYAVVSGVLDPATRVNSSVRDAARSTPASILAGSPDRERLTPYSDVAPCNELFSDPTEVCICQAQRVYDLSIQAAHESRVICIDYTILGTLAAFMICFIPCVAASGGFGAPICAAICAATIGIGSAIILAQCMASYRAACDAAAREFRRALLEECGVVLYQE